MRVVSNTSPISNLAIIGRLELLKRRYGAVRIPPAVTYEPGSGRRRYETAPCGTAPPPLSPTNSPLIRARHSPGPDAFRAVTKRGRFQWKRCFP